MSKFIKGVKGVCGAEDVEQGKGGAPGISAEDVKVCKYWGRVASKTTALEQASGRFDGHGWRI